MVSTCVNVNALVITHKDLHKKTLINWPCPLSSGKVCSQQCNYHWFSVFFLTDVPAKTRMGVNQEMLKTGTLKI